MKVGLILPHLRINQSILRSVLAAKDGEDITEIWTALEKASDALVFLPIEN